MPLQALIGWLIIGLIAGWGAGQLMRGHGFGLIGNIVVGLVGAFLGGWLFDLLNIGTAATWWGSLITAFVGAAILLAILGAFGRRRRRR